MVDSTIQKFLDTLANQNERSALTVRYFLQDLEEFASTQLKTTVTDLIKGLKAGTATEDPKEEQVYRILQSYATWLRKNRIDTGNNGARTVKLKLSWARTLMETNFVPISRTLFKQLVKSPKEEEPDISPVDKGIVRRVIMSLDDPRLQSLALWYSSMGWRATESLSLRLLNFEGLNLKTLKFDTLPAFVNTTGKHAKTKKGKRRQLTMEMARQLESYLAWKYRGRTINRKVDGKWLKVKVNPEPKPDDRVFTPLWTGTNVVLKYGEPKLNNIYNRTGQNFRDAMNRLGVGWEESGRRHKVTIHTFRRFCFTTCIRIAGDSYGKYHIGRKIHEYDKRTPEMIAEDFAKVEPYLTILDATQIEKKQALLEKEIEDIKKRLANLPRLEDL